MSDFQPSLDPSLFQPLCMIATERVIDFFMDPKMDGVRTRLRRGAYGLDAPQACRAAVLEQIDTLGEPGLRLGLLVYALEVLFSLVAWGQVADAVAQHEPPGAVHPVQALERLDIS